MRTAYLTTCSPVDPKSGHALRVNANWRIFARFGEVRVWAFDARPPPGERKLLAQQGVTAVGSRREARVPLLLRHARSFVAGRSMLYAKAMSARRTERLRRLLVDWQPDLLVIGDTWLADLLPSLAGIARVIAVDTHNVESELYRRIVAEQRWLGKPKFALFRRNVQRLERNLQKADVVFAVSEADAAIYRDEHGLPAVDVLPNAVDVDHYAPRSLIPEATKIAFTGSYGYWPNEAAALNLIALSRQLDALGIQHTVDLVGRDPTPAMLAAAGHSRRITVTGLVDDVRSHIAGAGLIVAPLTSGSGTKYKILEALSLARPVVTTPIGAEGLDLVDGFNASIAANLGELAGRVAGLLSQPERAARMGQAGRDYVVATHSLAALEARFRSSLLRLGLI